MYRKTLAICWNNISKQYSTWKFWKLHDTIKWAFWRILWPFLNSMLSSHYVFALLNLARVSWRKVSVKKSFFLCVGKSTINTENTDILSCTFSIVKRLPYITNILKNVSRKTFCKHYKQQISFGRQTTNGAFVHRMLYNKHHKSGDLLFISSKVFYVDAPTNKANSY